MIEDPSRDPRVESQGMARMTCGETCGGRRQEAAEEVEMCREGGSRMWGIENDEDTVDYKGWDLRALSKD
eukprot:767126-Hanusia_phi.AAC.4